MLQSRLQRTFSPLRQIAFCLLFRVTILLIHLPLSKNVDNKLVKFKNGCFTKTIITIFGKYWDPTEVVTYPCGTSTIFLLERKGSFWSPLASYISVTAVTANCYLQQQIKRTIRNISSHRELFAYSNLMDHLMFIYYSCIGVDDAVIYLLHRSLSHLESTGTLRVKFFDLSNAFKIIQQASTITLLYGQLIISPTDHSFWGTDRQSEALWNTETFI